MASETVYTKPFFELIPFDDYVIKELKSREQNVGMDASTATSSPYKGAYSSWVRACSNGVSVNKDGTKKEGFIMFGVSGFDDSLGGGTNNGSAVLGYDVNGQKHQIPVGALTLKNRPCPGVTGLDIEMVDAYFRRATLKWTCWSPEQLDYMEQFFMSPSLSIVLEWGWQNYNPASLLNLKDVGKPSQLEDASDQRSTNIIKVGSGLSGVFSDDNLIENRILQSRGNYDTLIGTTNSFSYKLNHLGGFDVTTEISSKSGLYSGYSAKNSVIKINNVVSMTIDEWLDQKLPKIVEDYKNKQPSQLFQKPTKIIEQRVFAGRSDNSQGNVFEWDFGNENTFYITFGVVIDIINMYITSQSETTGITTKFVIGQSWIRGHPNLKSTDGTVLLIPNSGAPAWDALNFVGAPSPSQTNSKDSADQLLLANTGTIKREDIAKIICSERLGTDGKPVSFPSYDSKAKGYAGLLGDLYVSRQVVVDAFKGKDTIVDALRDILGKMSGAACDFWDFHVKPVGNIGSDQANLTIIDRNFIGYKSSDELIQNTAVYNFKISAYQSITTDAEFTVKLADAVALQTLYSKDIKSANCYLLNQSGVLSVPTVIKDRLVGTWKVSSPDLPPTVTADSNNTDIRNGVDHNFYFVVKDSVKYALVEPSSELIRKLTCDTDVIQHTGCMPGTEIGLVILGIAGIKIMDYFTVSGLPARYSRGCVFQVNDVKHNIEKGKWSTTIRAGVRPAIQAIGKLAN
jgi:hypothetical protein